MRGTIAATAAAATLMPLIAFGQVSPPNRQASPPPAASASAPATGNRAAGSRGPSAPQAKAGKGAAPADPNVTPVTAVLTEPTPADQIKPATIKLPDDPIEPYLLTRQAGPFMVVAKSFRGPDAERFALALVLELRREYHLPAYVLRTKDFPHNSNIRNVPPIAPRDVQRPQLSEPEKVRSYDEAAVLVGDEKTEAGSLALLKKVKEIKPACLKEIPTPFHWRQDKGLKKALRTTNPFVPAQDLYPGRKRDALIAQMNDGPRSVFRCPDRFSLQVAEFGGRATFNPDDEKFTGMISLRRSPLITAAADAERVAEALAKDPAVTRTGMQPYVYHDRTSSRVLVGSFKSPDDPKALALRDILLKEAIPLAHPKRAGVVIVPATVLTDLEPIKGDSK